MRIFERILGRKIKEKILSISDSISELINPSCGEGYFINGEWMILRQCCAEYDMGSDSIIGGCGFIQEITEKDITVHCEVYTWRCEECGEYHAIAPHFIPDNVKYRIRNRSPYYNNKIIDFNSYKKTR